MSFHGIAVRQASATVDRLLARMLSVGDAVLDFAVAVLVVYLLGRVLVVPLVARAMSLRRVQPTLDRAVRKTTKAIIVVVALVVGLTFAGARSLLAPTALLTAALTLAVGFAAQDVLGNLVSGVFIVADPKFNIGDLVRWNDRQGRVEDISFRVTRIRAIDGELITVPNAELTKTSITNVDAADALRVVETFQIGYDEDLEAVRGAVRTAVGEVGAVLEEPSPAVLVRSFGDAGVEFEVQFWIAHVGGVDVPRARSTVLRRIDDRLGELGVELPDPPRTISGELALRRSDAPPRSPHGADGSRGQGTAAGPAPDRDGPGVAGDDARRSESENGRGRREEPSSGERGTAGEEDPSAEEQPEDADDRGRRWRWRRRRPFGRRRGG